MRFLILPMLACLAATALARDTQVSPTAPVAQGQGLVVTKPELVGFWFDRYPQEYARALDELVEGRVARAQAAQLGLTVPPDALARAVVAEVEARTKLVARVYGPNATLETWVRDGYDLDVAAWRRQILVPRLRSVLLKQRIVRLHTRRELRVHARIIVTLDARKAQRIGAKVRGGADFALVALNESEDATKKVGGTLPPIAHGDLAQFPIVEQRVFAAPVGTVLGPWRVMVDGKPQYHIYKVVKRDEPWRAQGTELLRRIENDIAATPVTQAELGQWQRHIRKTRGIRYLRPDGTPWK